MIVSVDIYDLRLPLKVPYGNSLGILQEFNTFLTVLTEEDGRVGMGEGTPAQPGYQWETPESIWGFVESKASEVLGKSAEEAHALLMGSKNEFPLACTSYLTALEELRQAPVLTMPQEGVRLPLVGIVNPPQGSSLESHLEQRLRQGFTTLKVKVGFAVDEDIRKVQKIQAVVGDAAKLRLDANQAYTPEEALRFVNSVKPDNIELLEQPFAARAWEPMRELAPRSPLPLMLDESIFNEEDVRRTGQDGCAQFIKFKLMKSASAVSMQQQMEMARGYGIKVLIGNGVSSDLGCYHESLIAARCGVAFAGEQNGYLKPVCPLFREPLGFADGHICIPAGYKRELDPDVLQKYSREQRHLTRMP